MEPVDRSSPRLSGLVDELDAKVATIRRTAAPPSRASAGTGSRLPRWLGMVLVTILGIAIGFAVVRPWDPRCDYSQEFCAVARLDIDAVWVTVPDSALIAALPDLATVDADDRLTVAGAMRLDRFAGRDIAELLTTEELEQVLAVLGQE